MSKIHLTKEYERDISLVIEGLWARKIGAYLARKFNIESPYKPYIVFFVNEENMQIWENAQALSWYKDRLLEENLKGSAFIEEIISEYELLLKEIQCFWKNGPTADKKALKKYINLVDEAISLFSVWYYPLIDERTPKKISKVLQNLRSTDEFFARNDLFIKDCVEVLGGRRELANFILVEEFPELPDKAVLAKRKKGVVSIDGKVNFFTTLD